MENLKEFWLKEPESIGCDIQYCSPHLTSSHLEIYNSAHSSTLPPAQQGKNWGGKIVFICRQKQTSLCWTAASLMMLDISHNYYQKISSNIPSNRLNISHQKDNSTDDPIDKSKCSYQDVDLWWS